MWCWLAESQLRTTGRFWTGGGTSTTLKDAANVADLASRGRCQYYDRPSEKIIELRDLLSLRRRLKKDEHVIRVRIRNTVLAKYFPELDKFFNTGKGEILSIVKWCPNPAKIA